MGCGQTSVVRGGSKRESQGGGGSNKLAGWGGCGCGRARPCFGADEITRNVVRAVMPSYIKLPPLPMNRSPRSEVIRGRLTVNNYMPHFYMFAHEDGPGYIPGGAAAGRTKKPNFSCV